MKIILVINPVCACVRTSAKDDDFQKLSREGRECVLLMVLFNLSGFMFQSVRCNIIRISLGLQDIRFWSIL